jgi:L-alanine-DL-glutamate epimerase-like enolase superfamily enzyme
MLHLWHGNGPVANTEMATTRSLAGVDLNSGSCVMELSRQLLCCLPNGHILEHLDVRSLTDLGALAEPIRIADGWFTRPDRPGHGIIFDRATLAAHAVEA